MFKSWNLTVIIHNVYFNRKKCIQIVKDRHQFNCNSKNNSLRFLWIINKYTNRVTLARTLQYMASIIIKNRESVQLSAIRPHIGEFRNSSLVCYWLRKFDICHIIPDKETRPRNLPQLLIHNEITEQSKSSISKATNTIFKTTVSRTKGKDWEWFKVSLGGHITDLHRNLTNVLRVGKTVAPLMSHPSRNRMTMPYNRRDSEHNGDSASLKL